MAKLVLGGVMLGLSACKSVPTQPIKEGGSLSQEISAGADEWELASAEKINSQDFAGALKDLLPAAHSRPDDYLVHYRLGVCYEYFKDYDKAMACYSLAISLHPTHNSHLRRASVNVLWSNYAEALADLDRAYILRKGPPNSEFYTLKAIAFHGLGRDAETIDSATLALMEDVRWADAYNMRGLAFLRTRRFFEAIKDFTRAIALFPERADWRYNRAMAFAQTQDYEPAIADLHKALELEPRNDTYTYHMGVYLAESGNFVKALTYLGKAYELNPVPSHLVGRALCYAKLNQFTLATADLDQAIGQTKEDAPAHWFGLRGTIKHQSGDNQAALPDLKKAIALGIQDANIYDAMGMALSASKKWSEAVGYFDRAIELSPTNALFYEHRGIAQADAGNAAKGVDDFTRAISLNPKMASAYNNRGYTLLEQGNIEAAIGDFDRCIELDSLYGIAYINRGNAKKLKGDDIGAALDLARGTVRTGG